VVVEIARDKASFDSMACPDGVNAVLGAAVKWTVAIALVKYEE
jgi:hypothetical protein